ncbi:MAG: YafY family protein [bacterium]|nr:YafY family protein [bacterium]
MAKYDRLLYILNLLRSRRNLNAARIAEECGVTERSIYRDILALSEANIPIYYDRGYKLASQNFLPPLNFDLEEYQYFKMTIDSSPLKVTDKYRHIAKRVRAKVESILSDSVREKSRFTNNPTHIDNSQQTDRPSSVVFFETIEKGIEMTRVLSLEYDSIESGLTKRRVEPYFIIFRGRAFYFVAYCQTRKELRTFRIGRVKSVRATTDEFNPDPTVQPEKYFEDSWELFSGEPVRVTILFRGKAARIVRAGNHHPRETIKEIDDDCIEYSVNTRGLDEIQRWILGFGDEAEVLSPGELRQNILALVTSLKSKYSS